jgi:hypothetical protein
MTTLEMALILFVFSWALRVPAEPARDRVHLQRSLK